MGKVAFVFSGQGDQYPGMGKELFENYKVAKEVFQMCDAIRPGTSEQCFFGNAEELCETKNTQPCLFALELAAARTLIDMGTEVSYVAGFSLGELTAAAVSGLLDDETGFRLVCSRGELMEREAKRFPASMAAVVKLSPQTVERICGEFSQVYPVNYNCPGQITVSGTAEELLKFKAAVKSAGGRAIPLKVGGGFHSPFMDNAWADFEKILKNVNFSKMKIPLFSDVTGEIYGENPVKLLSVQIKSPVRWEKIVRNMVSEGVDTFIEVGPGKTLCNMIGRTDPNVTALSVTEYLKER